jgi:uncharacterized protein YgiM (DUF1202 family)
LPASGNSENITHMKSLPAFRCLVIATTSLLAATLPLASFAQELPPDAPPAASQPVPQQRFVSDKLVLNVYAEPDQGSARVATIQTGDAIDELQRVGNMVQVRLEDGREGWVGANYLVSDAPAIVRLRELQRQPNAVVPQVDKGVERALTLEVAQLKKENATLRGQVSELQSRAAADAAVASSSENENNIQTHGETPTPEPTLAAATLAGTEPPGGVLGWLVAIMLVGAASYAGGYQTLARRLRKKFGGLKIY